MYEDRQGAMKCLPTPKHSFAGITPLAALSSDKGAKQVEELLDRAEYGIYG
ncbi:antitoxin Xre/MbcA/ParS toxin-binding domain-containing protein [Chamaesiphon sp.]|uniref:antitoxin Xre/MbcA/ParS toxin-binding domain-containing protein n=1 Tax=Chamaesiphon sp. TaxID=2814140 RepID=UPI0035944EC8